MAGRRAGRRVVIAVPPALSPWAAGLERLPGELALGLYPWIARLTSALGPLAAAESGVPGEPDGYAGLTRRGPYHRLLGSEWLLLFEIPDEFVRRAAQAEHMLFELANQRSAGSRRALVLFDAGPSQLGAARLVHLAALIAFARRAQTAAADLSWGIVQAPQAGWVSGVSRSGVELLMRSRSAHVPTAAHARQWSERIGALNEHDDAWLVGGAELRALPELGAWPRLQLEEALEPELRSVTAQLEHRARPAQRLVLTLPSPRVCVQLLRDPYASAEPKLQSTRLAVDISRPIWFSGDGHRLFAWLDDAAAVSFAVPNSPRAAPSKPRVLRARAGETLLACGSRGGRMLGLSQARSGELYLYGSHGTSSPLRLVSAVQRGAPALPALVPDDWRSSTMFEADGRIVALNHRGGLLEANAGAGRSDAKPDVMQFTFRDAILASAPLTRHRGLARIRLGFAPGGELEQRHVCLELEGAEPQRHFIGLEYGFHDAELCSCDIGCVSPGEQWIALRTSPRGLLVCPIQRPSVALRFELPSSGTLCGLLGVRGEPCLLVLEDDRHRLSLLGRQRSVELPRAQSEIAHVCVSTMRTEFAYLTRTGELVAFDAEQWAPLLRVRCEASA
jgi:hypothetical protein